MTHVPDDNKAKGNEDSPRPYPPSWVDLFTEWLDRLPGPMWAYYFGIGLIVLVALTAIRWAEGAITIASFPPAYLFYAGAAPFFLALFHVLDRVTGTALETLRPAMTTTEEEYESFRYRLTTLPPGATVVASLVVFLVTIPLDALLGMVPGLATQGAVSASAVVDYVTYRLLWWIFGALMYHTIHQLGLIDRILTHHTRINVFKMSPLYAFSQLTALTAVGVVGPPYLFGALNPGSFREAASLAMFVPILILGVAIFVWPLLGVHRMLVAEKTRLLAEAAARFEATLALLHQRVDTGDLEDMDDLSKTIGSLESEQKALEGIPTWPWSPETVRLLMTAVAVPLGLWIVQLVLEQLLGA